MTNKTDRELLELAARAVGYTYKLWDGEFHGIVVDKEFFLWSPLEDDGDAFRLMVDLAMLVDVDDALNEVQVIGTADQEIAVDFDDNRHAATRRAIVLAAAEIGERNA